MATDEIKHVVSIEADLAKIQTQIKGLEGDFTKGFKGIESAALGLGRHLAGAFSITALIGFGKSVVDAAGHLQDLQEQTGISAQLLSGLESTFIETGTSAEAFAKGIFTAQKNLGQINSESDQAAIAIKQLGLNLNELRNATPERFLELISGALAKIDNPVQRAAAGAAILGRQFQELAPAIAATAGRLEEFRRQGLTPEDIKRLDDFGDAWTRVANRMKIAAGGAFADAIRDLETIGRLIRQNILLFRLSEQGQAAFGGALAGGVKEQPGAAGLEDVLKAALKPQKPAAAFIAPPNIAAAKKAQDDLKKAQEETRKAEEQSFKALGEHIDEVAKKYTDAGDTIREVFREIRQLALTPQEKALADINKQFDEMIQKLERAGEVTGQSFGPQIENLEFFRRQQRLLAETPTTGADLIDTGEGADREAARQRFLDLGKAAADFQDRMREIAALSQVFGSSFDTLGASIAATRSEIERLISVGLDPLDPKITELKRKLDEFQSTLRDADTAEAVIRAGAGAITDSFRGVIMGTQSVSEAFRNMGRNIALSLADITLQILIIEPLIKRMRSALEKAGGFAGLFGMGGTSTSSIPTLGPETTFSRFGSSFIPVPFLQQGGIITQQTLAMLHPQEAVVPLGRKDILGQKQPNVTVQINGDITPKREGMSRDQIIQVVVSDLDNRGVTMRTLENRLSPARR